MTQTRPSPFVMAALLTLHAVVTTLVWRDIGRRPTAQLRGGRSLWRTLTALNTGNSLAYALIGVRRRPEPTTRLSGGPAPRGRRARPARTGRSSGPR